MLFHFMHEDLGYKPMKGLVWCLSVVGKGPVPVLFILYVTVFF